MNKQNGIKVAKCGNIRYYTLYSVYTCTVCPEKRLIGAHCKAQYKKNPYPFAACVLCVCARVLFRIYFWRLYS